MTFDMIAQKLGLSVAEVRMAYTTGMRKIKKELVRRRIKYTDYFNTSREIHENRGTSRAS